MEYTLATNNKDKEVTKGRFEDTTIENIELLEEELEGILLEVSNWDRDIGDAKNLIMYKLLLFILHNKHDENILHRYSWQYFEKNKKELKELVP